MDTPLPSDLPVTCCNVRRPPPHSQRKFLPAPSSAPRLVDSHPTGDSVEREREWRGTQARRPHFAKVPRKCARGWVWTRPGPPLQEPVMLSFVNTDFHLRQ